MQDLMNKIDKTWIKSNEIAKALALRANLGASPIPADKVGEVVMSMAFNVICELIVNELKNTPDIEKIDTPVLIKTETETETETPGLKTLAETETKLASFVGAESTEAASANIISIVP